MKTLLLLTIFLTTQPLIAAQKAKVMGSEVEIYSDADFDSQVMTWVRKGETYQISNKTYGPFYRIKLKNGKVGYIVDYELDIEGKGPFKQKDLDEVMMQEALALAKKNPAATENDDDEETQLFGRLYSGPTLQLVNYHEDTLGGIQTDNLPAVGFKNVSLVAWSLLASFKAPAYYAEKRGGTAKGIKLWGDFGFSNPIGSFGRSELRFAATLFAHISVIQLDTPLRKYDLHDLSAGIAAEFGWLYQFKKSAVDFYMKYYFDKTNYAGLGLSYLF